MAPKSVVEDPTIRWRILKPANGNGHSAQESVEDPTIRWRRVGGVRTDYAGQMVTRTKKRNQSVD